MEALQQLKDIAANPKAYARAWKEKTGGKVVGHFCSYTPEEIITAAGALPVRTALSGPAAGVIAGQHLALFLAPLVVGEHRPPDVDGEVHGGARGQR